MALLVPFSKRQDAKHVFSPPKPEGNLSPYLHTLQIILIVFFTPIFFFFSQGPNCEFDFSEGRCTDNLCKNGGSCRNFLLGGFECVCSGPEFDGQLCEIRTRNFPESSFLMFRSLNRQIRFQMSLR